MSLTQGFPSTFSATQGTNEVLHNLDNETKKIYNDINSFMAADGHSHTGNGSDGALLSVLGLSGGTLTGVLNEHLGDPIASASTINLTTATGNFLHVTGTTTITAVTLGVGMRREIIFDGILTLTHHATNNNLPGGADIITAVGDRASYHSDGTTVYCTKYVKADGTSVISQSVASQAEAIVGTDNTKIITPLQLRNGLNASGTAPIYACRAWVNFNGVPLTGTYSQSGTTVTVTMTAHGLSVSDNVNLSITSGTGVSGSYTVATVVSANIFTYVAGTSLNVSGNITRNIYIRASGNVSSITDNGVGDYTINFANAMPDSNYACMGVGRDMVGGSSAVASPAGSTVDTLTNVVKATSVRVRSIKTSDIVIDSDFVSISIFR